MLFEKIKLLQKFQDLQYSLINLHIAVQLLHTYMINKVKLQSRICESVSKRVGESAMLGEFDSCHENDMNKCFASRGLEVDFEGK